LPFFWYVRPVFCSVPEAAGLRKSERQLAASSVLDRATGVGVPAGILVAIGVIVGIVGSDVIARVTTLGLINVVLVVGLYVFVGNAGVLSFGQMSFMAIGGYVSGALTIPLQMRHVLLPHLPGPLGTELLSTSSAILVGGLTAAAAAIIVAVPLMRLSGLAAGIATLAVLQITEVVASNWDDMTGGAASMPGVPRTTGMWTALAWAVGVLLVAFIFQTSSHGLRLRASREDEGAAASVGVNVVSHRILAYCLSAFIVAIGGGLYVHFLGTFSPESFYLGTTFTTLAMLVVGGTNSLFGAVLGAVLLSALGEVLIRVEQAAALPNLQEIGLGLIMLMILILRPSGITGGREVRMRLRPWRGRSRIGAASAPKVAALDQEKTPSA
jgi:branched-chain amino acid transport system permease protein